MAALRTSEPSKQTSRTEAAEYIALELGRLMRMASAHGFTMLPYLIDMAVLEAWREASESTGRNGSGPGPE